MAIKKTSREEILKHSIKLFKINGYYNTSMANIAEACGIIKGSIYHHFKSKEEIGLESLKMIHQYFVDEIYSVAYRDNLNDLEKLKLFVKKTDDYFLESEGGCLLGNLALEISSENVLFKDEIRAYFRAWEEALVFILNEQFGEEEALELAQECVALTQGSIMMMVLYGTSENYLKTGQQIIELL